MTSLPYAFNERSATTFPEIATVPLKPMERRRSSGVNVTLKNVAVKFLLSVHRSRELDLITREAETGAEQRNVSIDSIDIRSIAALN